MLCAVKELARAGQIILTPHWYPGVENDITRAMGHVEPIFRYLLLPDSAYDERIESDSTVLRPFPRLRSHGEFKHARDQAAVQWAEYSTCRSWEQALSWEVNDADVQRYTRKFVNALARVEPPRHSGISPLTRAIMRSSQSIPAIPFTPTSKCPILCRRRLIQLLNPLTRTCILVQRRFRSQRVARKCAETAARLGVSRMSRLVIKSTRHAMSPREVLLHLAREKLPILNFKALFGQGPLILTMADLGRIAFFSKVVGLDFLMDNVVEHITEQAHVTISPIGVQTPSRDLMPVLACWVKTLKAGLPHHPSLRREAAQIIQDAFRCSAVFLTRRHAARVLQERVMRKKWDRGNRGFEIEEMTMARIALGRLPEEWVPLVIGKPLHRELFPESIYDLSSQLLEVADAVRSGDLKGAFRLVQLIRQRFMNPRIYPDIIRREWAKRTEVVTVRSPHLQREDGNPFEYWYVIYGEIEVEQGVRERVWTHVNGSSTPELDATLVELVRAFLQADLHDVPKVGPAALASWDPFTVASGSDYEGFRRQIMTNLACSAAFPWFAAVKAWEPVQRAAEGEHDPWDSVPVVTPVMLHQLVRELAHQLKAFATPRIDLRHPCRDNQVWHQCIDPDNARGWASRVLRPYYYFRFWQYLKKFSCTWLGAHLYRSHTRTNVGSEHWEAAVAGPARFAAPEYFALATQAALGTLSTISAVIFVQSRARSASLPRTLEACLAINRLYASTSSDKRYVFPDTTPKPLLSMQRGGFRYLPSLCLITRSDPELMMIMLGMRTQGEHDWLHRVVGNEIVQKECLSLDPPYGSPDEPEVERWGDPTRSPVVTVAASRGGRGHGPRFPRTAGDMIGRHRIIIPDWRSEEMVEMLCRKDCWVRPREPLQRVTRAKIESWIDEKDPAMEGPPSRGSGVLAVQALREHSPHEVFIAQPPSSASHTPRWALFFFESRHLSEPGS